MEKPSPTTFEAHLELANLDKKIDQQAKLEGLHSYDQEIERAKKLNEEYKKTHNFISARLKAATETGFARLQASVVPFWSRSKKVEQDRRLIREGAVWLNSDMVSGAARQASELYDEPDNLIDVADKAIATSEISAYRQRTALQGHQLETVDSQGVQNELGNFMQLIEQAISDYAVAASEGNEDKTELLELRQWFLEYFRQNYSQDLEVGEVMADNMLEIADQAAAFYAENKDVVDQSNFVKLGSTRVGAMSTETVTPVNRLKRLTNRFMSTRVGEVVTNPLVWEAALWTAKKIPFVGGATAGGARKALMESSTIKQVDRELTYGYQTADRSDDKHRQEILATFSERYQVSDIISNLQTLISEFKSSETSPPSLDQFKIDLATASALYEAYQQGNHRLNFDKGQSEAQHLQLVKLLSQATILADERGYTEDINGLKETVLKEDINPNRRAQSKRQTRYVAKKAARSAAITGTLSLASMGVFNADHVADWLGDQADNLPLAEVTTPAHQVAESAHARVEAAIPFISLMSRQAIKHGREVVGQEAQHVQQYWQGVTDGLYEHAEAADNVKDIIDQAPSVEVADHAPLTEHTSSHDFSETYGTLNVSEFNELGLKVEVQPDGNLLLDTSSMLPDANGDGIVELPVGVPRFAVFQMDDSRIYQIPLDSHGQIVIDPSVQPELFQVDASGHVEFTFNRLAIGTPNADGGLTYHASITDQELEKCLPNINDLAPSHTTTITPIAPIDTANTTSATNTVGDFSRPGPVSHPSSTGPIANAGPDSTPNSPLSPDGEGTGFSTGPINEPLSPKSPAEIDTSSEAIKWRPYPTNPLMQSEIAAAKNGSQNAAEDPNGITPFPEADPNGITPAAELDPNGITPAEESDPNGISPFPEAEDPNGITPFEDPNGITPVAEIDPNGITPFDSIDRNFTPIEDQDNGITPVDANEQITPFPEAAYKAEMAAMRAEMDELKKQLAKLSNPSRPIRAENAFKATRKDPKGIIENPGYIPEKFMKRAEQDATPANKRGIRNYTYTQARRILGVDANHPDWQAALPKLQSALDTLFNQWDSLDVQTRRRRLRQLANGAVLRGVVQGLPQSPDRTARPSAPTTNKAATAEPQPAIQPNEPTASPANIEPLFPPQPEPPASPKVEQVQSPEDSLVSALAKTDEADIDGLINRAKNSDQSQIREYLAYLNDELSDTEIKALTKHVMTQQGRGDQFKD